MIYFSAHWCPPCRGFTPSLAKFVEANKDKANFEAVFVSSDRDEGSFKEYLATMGFRALPFADRERKASLSAKFKVQGIPTLVVVGPDGQTITTKGREAVSKDPTAENFPWTPKTILQALFDPDSSGAEPEFVAVDGSKVTAASLQENDVLGLYFSAHWCPPCRGFTPTLASWYKDKKPSAKPPMDLVFISSDKTKDEFDSYHREMGFPALAFADRKRKEDLSEVLGVEGIPTLVFIDPKTGKVLVKDGRARVTASPDEFPWPAKPVEPIDIAIGDINDTKIALLFTDKLTSAAAEEEATKAFEEAAKPFFALNDDSIKFAFCPESSEWTDRLRGFFNMTRDSDGPTSVQVVVTDIPNGIKYKWDGSGVPSTDDVRTFVDSVIAGSASPVGLKD
jgi:nucleoredoxin